VAPIFNGLQPSKMTVHSCTVHRLSKNRVFNSLLVTFADAKAMLAC